MILSMRRYELKEDVLCYDLYIWEFLKDPGGNSTYKSGANNLIWIFT